jgi:hypothetical protein
MCTPNHKVASRTTTGQHTQEQPRLYLYLSPQTLKLSSIADLDMIGSHESRDAVSSLPSLDIPNSLRHLVSHTFPIYDHM